MKYAYRIPSVLFLLLPMVAWLLLALRPIHGPGTALAETTTDEVLCDPRADFQIVSVHYRDDLASYQAHAPITTYPGFPGVRTWYFTDPGADIEYGAKLIITWQLKNNVRNTEIGNKLMQNAATLDDWYVRVKFHPNITFSGNVSVQGYQIIQEIPLDNLSDGPKSLDFRVVYQDSPTCTSTQDPSQQIIAFYNSAFSGNGDGRGDRRPPRRRAPLTWTTSITAETLGAQPADYLEGKTLSDIVNSRTTGRPDGLMCSTCHSPTNSNPYRPPVGRRAQEITPSLLIQSGKRSPTEYTWNGSGSSGIVSHFVQNPIGKPPPLEAAFNKWLADGGQ
jgi:hypothetical protein